MDKGTWCYLQILQSEREQKGLGKEKLGVRIEEHIWMKSRRKCTVSLMNREYNVPVQIGTI